MRENTHIIQVCSAGSVQGKLHLADYVNLVQCSRLGALSALASACKNRLFPPNNYQRLQRVYCSESVREPTVMSSE